MKPEVGREHLCYVIYGSLDLQYVPLYFLLYVILMYRYKIVMIA